MDSKAVSTQQIISTANTKFNDIKSLNNQFLGFVSNTLLTIKNPITLSILGQSLIVDFFDIKAKAYPRFVLAGINPPVFFVEYIFLNIDEDKKEAGRFYLTDTGKLIEKLDNSASICDFNDVNFGNF